MPNLSSLHLELREASNPEKAKILQRFFKTGPGQYGEGDIFLGLVAQQSHALAKKYKDLKLKDLQTLLNSKIHEHRSIALEILVKTYKKNPEEIYKFYLSNTKYINNWDLVDLSAHKIVGIYLENKPRDILYKLARSQNLWEKRIAIISTFHFIRQNDFQDALNISEILLQDKHDLIHKAVGWMLREVGKRNQPTLEKFLKKHYKKMPRTMLRYSIERFEEPLRQSYLKTKI